MRRRRVAELHGGESEERWLLTYSDMITLLLALFVVLFALSSLNQLKFAEFRTGVRQAFASKSSRLSKGSTGLLNQTSLVSHQGSVHALRPAHLPAGATAPTAITVAPEIAPAHSVAPAQASARLDSAQLVRLEQLIHAALASQGLLPEVRITLTKSSLSVGLVADKVFFTNNSAALAPIGARVVDVVGRVLASRANQVVVRGYTDSVPVTGGPYFSNFMLSAARAATVVLRLDHHDGVAAPRLRAVGYGSTHPVATNSTASGRAENRRVDIVVKAEGVAS